MRSSTGPFLIIVGIVLVIVGALAWGGWFSWFGRLPGDIRIERPNLRVYIPLTSMLLVSIVFSLLLAVIRRMR